MSSVQTCPNGHQWTAPEVPADPSGASRCPVCAGDARTGDTASFASDLTPPPPRQQQDTAPSQGPAPTGVPRRPEAGQTFGKYELLAELGRGGMGVVYLARDRTLDRRVALKVILHAGHAGAELLQRFRREAEAVARIQHPNVVPVYEFGEWHGLPYLAMEHLGGGDLRGHPAVVSREPRAVAELFLTLAQAVDAAHQRAIVHRDLKPANVLLDAEGRPKVGDFGLAKRLDGGVHVDAHSPMTMTGAVMGTPAYMAPEQLDGDNRAVTPAADVYAVGAMLYEALTGQRPRQGNTLEAMRRASRADPAPPSRLTEGRRLPRDLETICLKCLAPDAHRRYATAGELAADLGRFLRSEPVHARRTGMMGRAVRWSRRRPVRAFAVGLAAVLLVVAAYAAWYVDAHVLPRTQRFAAVTSRSGAPVGIGESLTPERAERMGLSFELTRRGRRGPVVWARIVDGQGQDLADNPFRTHFDGIFGDEPVIAWSRNEYDYDRRGRLLRERARDPAGRTVYDMQFSYPGDGGNDGVARARYLREMGTDLGVPQAPTLIEFERDAEGRDRVVRFLDGSGRPIPNLEGAFAYRYAYNAAGLPERVESLDAGGTVAPNRLGFAAARIEYDGQLRESVVRFLDAAGRPARHRDGYAATATAYDADGKVASLTFLDADGRPTPNVRLGAARVRMEYGGRGKLTGHRLFDAADRPVK